MDDITRRQAILAAGAAAVVGGVPTLGTAVAQVVDPRPPVVDTDNIEEISAGVWVIKDHRTWLVPNIGIVLGKDAALVIDTGLGPENGEKVLKLARRLAGNRKLILTLTHFHPEHGFGAQAFVRDASITYNTSQRDELLQKGASYIELFRKTQGKAVAEALQGTEIVEPHSVYDGARTEIDLGDRIVHLLNWGAAHTRGDQVIYLPAEKVLFTGDLIEERMFPIFPWFPPNDADVDAVQWVKILRNFSKLSPQLIVPGHGDIGQINIAHNLAKHIETVSSEVTRLKAGKSSDKEILENLKKKIMNDQPDWDNPGLLDWEIQYFIDNPGLSFKT